MTGWFRRSALAAAAALPLILAAGEVSACGVTGHWVTGAIAERYLSGEARAAVVAILGTEGLAEASTWPDFMRSDPSEFWQRTASPWHYVTVPKGKNYADVAAPPEGDAVTALKRFATILRDPSASLIDRRLALRFTVPIVGDLHQPLHVGNGADRGGNDVRVRYFGESTNLHALWDSGIIDRQLLSYSELADQLLARVTPDNLAEWSNPDPMVWVAESAIVRDEIYPADGNDNLSYGYDFAHLATVEQRLLQGGIRIAAYLNALFGGR